MASDPKTVTSPSGRKVRIPSASGVLNSQEFMAFNLTRANPVAIDAQLTGVQDGRLVLVIAKGRLGRFELTTVTRIEDEFQGQPVRSAA